MRDRRNECRVIILYIYILICNEIREAMASSDKLPAISGAAASDARLSRRECTIFIHSVIQ